MCLVEGEALASSAGPQAVSTESLTALEEVDSTALGDKIPLILVHGIHGNQTQDGCTWKDMIIREVNTREVNTREVNTREVRKYWNRFIEFFSSTEAQTLRAIYKLLSLIHI